MISVASGDAVLASQLGAAWNTPTALAEDPDSDAPTEDPDGDAPAEESNGNLAGGLAGQ